MRSKDKSQRGSGGRAHAPDKDVVRLLAAWGRAGNDVTDVDEAVKHLQSKPQYRRQKDFVVKLLVQRAIQHPDLDPNAPEARLQVRCHHACMLRVSTFD